MIRIQTMFDYAWRHHWNTERYQKSGWAMEVWKYWNGHLVGPFGRMKASDVKVSDVRRFHHSLAEKPVTANRCLEVLSRVFSFAEENELVPLGTNPCRFVKAYREKQRSRYASEAEVMSIGKVLLEAKGEDLVRASFVRLLLLTGIRPRTLARAELKNLTSVSGVSILRQAAKSTEITGDDEATVFSVAAMLIVNSLPKREDGLIIGPVRYREYWDKVRIKAGCPDLWLRDARRTFATVGRGDGISMDTIGELLNHRSRQTTERYAKLIPAKKIAAASRVSSRMSELLGGNTWQN